MYRVNPTADGYAVELQQHDGSWLNLGIYADAADAVEIVMITNTGHVENSHDGRRPDSAVPFSAFEGIEEWM